MNITSKEIYFFISDIGATDSKNEKEAMLASFRDNDLLKDTLKYAYDPFIRYGIRKRPSVSGHGTNAFNVNTFALLRSLANRTLTGTAAIEAVRKHMEWLDEDSAELFWRIVKKDMRAGFSEETINKVWKGLLPTFPYMRCSLPKKAKWDKWNFAKGCYSQKKADGMFANFNMERDGSISIISRQGSEFPIESFPDDFIQDVINTLPSGYQYHGELLVTANGKILPREIGNGTLNSVLNGGEFEAGTSPIYEVWDCIPLEAVVAKGKYSTPYHERYEFLNDAITMQELANGKNCGVRLIETRIVHSLDEAFAHYAEKLGGGEEGTIVKSRDAIWKDGTSTEQIKLKLEVDVDLKITGIQEGNEGTRNEGRPGAFTCESSDGLLKVDVTVKNEALRDRVEAKPEEFIGRIIAVRANQVLKPSDSNPLHSLFLPRMVEADYRIDKTEADSLSDVKDQFEAAISV